MDMFYQKYRCVKCGAEDTDKLFLGEIPAPAIDCWKCHSGQSKTLADMFSYHVGMFPVLEEATHA
jgi:hypothetical protein